MALQVYRWIILKQDTLALRRQLHPALILCVPFLLLFTWFVGALGFFARPSLPPPSLRCLGRASGSILTYPPCWHPNNSIVGYAVLNTAVVRLAVTPMNGDADLWCVVVIG